MKILTVLGARPQFIKAAPLSRCFASTEGIDETVVHTGQHFDDNMSKVFFEQMGLPRPAYNLGIHGLGHGAMIGRMIEGLERVLIEEKPDLVLVYGDTNSTLAGAVAARKAGRRIAHVEAGLRSFNREMPEETNRILTDRISDYLFCPTATAVRNLMAEGFERFPCEVLQTGDVMLDAVLLFSPVASRCSTVVRDLALAEFTLATVHRQENTDDGERLASIVRALNRVNEETRVVMPIHPRTRQALEREGIQVEFTVIDAVGYLDMLQLLKRCRLVMTDSGGLQKEAYFFKKPSVTLRNETEWTELIEIGANALAGADEERIRAAFSIALTQEVDFDGELYGDGRASQRIVEALLGAAG